MPARDLVHNAVRHALEKDGWLITHDPLHLRVGGIDVYIDLGAEEITTTSTKIAHLFSRAGDDCPMGKLEQYRTTVQAVLDEYAKPPRLNDEGVELQTIFDPLHDHYQLAFVGWEKQRRVYGNLVHIDIKGEKVWVQRDHTEVGIASQLVEAGIPKSDIVLGYTERKWIGRIFGQGSENRSASC